MTGKYLTEIHGFTAAAGWANPADAGPVGRSYCSALEDGNILFLPTLPHAFSESDLKFLYSLDQDDSAIHKNISYRPKSDVLRGFGGAPDKVETMHRIMREYSAGVVKMMTALLPAYAAKWSLDYASYRPYEEENRDLPLHKRNDLVHTDAFPSRPTHGGMILRCFSNVNPQQPRVWSTTERFPVLAEEMAKDAGLQKFAARQNSPLNGIRKGFNALKGVVGLKAPNHSAYDLFMLGFHDYLKENTAFQKDAPKIRTDFPPLSTWITFTDMVPHAVLSGRYAMEQTFIVPVNALVDQAKAPVRVLEKIAGTSLVS